MSIRSDLTIDISSYKKSLNEADAAAIKYARNQEQHYQKQQKELKAIETELQRLHKVREASNNPKAVRQYTTAIEKLEKEQEQLRQETEKYQHAVEKTSSKATSSFKKMGRSAKLWISGAVVSGFIALQSVLRNMSGEMRRFDQKMNEALAIQGKVTMEQRNRMETAAKEVAKELNIATDKVAQGYFYLASAGLDVEQQIANLPKVAEFAKAGMFDLATATDLATDAQSALGMTVKNTTQNQRNLVRVTDVLTKANTESNATIQQFSEALTNKAGARLRQFNKEVEEGTAVLAAYADQGIKGQRAGERLNILYRELASTWRENTEQFKEMGVAVFDQNGEMRNTATIIAELEKALAGMSAEQRSAKLAQLGFTSESQDSINALIGLSDKIAKYEQSLRNAAGTTEEVADNQLKSFNERLGLLKRSFIDAFGDDVTNAMQSTIRMLESVKRAVMGTRAEMEKEATLSTAFQKSGLNQQAKMPGGNILDDWLGTGVAFKRPREELRAFYDEQVKVTDQFNQTNRELSKNIEQYSTWASSVEGAQEKVKNANEELLFREHVLSRNIEKNKKLIEAEDTSAAQKAKLIIKNKALNKRLESVNKQLDASRKYISTNTEQQKEQEKAVSNLADKYLTFQGYLERIAMLGNQISAGKFQGVANAVGNIEEQMARASEGDVLGAQMDSAIRNIERYNQALTEANNELKTGAITQEQYEQKIKEASDAFLDQVKKIYKSIKDELSPAQEKAWSKIIENIKDSGDEVKNTGDQLRDLADMADSVINVADAFGAIGDNARKSLTGISDVLRSTQKLMDLGDNAGFLDFAVPGIGLASGLLSMISAGVSNNGSREYNERMRELEDSIEKNIRALNRNTQAYMEESVVGSDVSQSQIDQATSIVESWFKTETRTVRGEKQEVQLMNWKNITKQQFEQQLQTLGEIFPEQFGEAEEMFQNLLDQGYTFREAVSMMVEGFQDFEGIQSMLGDIETNVGEYGESIYGAVQRFEDALEYGGMTVSQAFDQFISDLEGLQHDIPQSLLEEMENLDLSTKAGRQRLQEIVQMLFQNADQYMGDMTPEEWRNFLDHLKGLAEGDGSSASGSEASGYSRSVQIARTITDVQANEMIMFLERIEKWTRDTAAAMGSEVAIDVNEGGGMMPELSFPVPLPVKVKNTDAFPSFDIPLPLPAKIINDQIPVKLINQMTSGGGNNGGSESGGSGNDDGNNNDSDSPDERKHEVNIGGVQIGRENITDKEIDEIGRRFSEKLKEQIRGGQF